MSRCLEDKDPSEWSYKLDSTVISAEYCTETGLLKGDNCTSTATGWYQSSRIPAICTGDHEDDSKATPSPSPAPSASPSATPEPSISPSPSPSSDTSSSSESEEEVVSESNDTSSLEE